jgi:penicillin-binding protein 1A
MPNGSRKASGRDNVTQTPPHSAPLPKIKPRRSLGQLRQDGFSWLGALGLLIALPVAGLMCGALVAALALLLANDRLPPLDALIDYKPRIPLRVYTADNVLIGEFGEERRTYVKIGDVPPLMTNAVLAAEDARFFEHGGVDFIGIIRSAGVNLLSSGKEQGASTITMQIAKTYTRKIIEILLALRIEEQLTKEQILELYMNQIFLGKRAYGFAAASQTYFGKPLSDISAAEAAMLAGLPKAPSRFNPLVNPKRATERQRYILRRMREFNFIDEPAYQAALAETLKYASSTVDFALNAPYVAEIARQAAHDLYKEDSYTAGIKVYTTILSEDQMAANAAVKQGVLDYDRKYGYRGPEGFIDLASNAAKLEEQVESAIGEAGDLEEFLAAVVLDASPTKVRVSRGKGNTIELTGSALRFVGNSLSPRAEGDRKLRRGAIVRIVESKPGQFEMSQLPEVESAFVACNTEDGSVRALVGGFNFTQNKFNRVIQSIRQPGSSFKPFIYSAALEKGFMTTTIINDSPVTIDPALTGGQLWEPKNYDGGFSGPMQMRTGLAKSKNMVSIRILQNIGPKYAQDYITRFGFDPEKNPPYLTMALGAGSVTPWQMVGAFSVFANGGFRIDPFLISKMVNQQGQVVAEAQPTKAGDESIRAIDGRNAFIMDSMMRDVIQKGTATKAKVLKRNDLAGKTGTTNDSHDAWFAGYSPKIAAIAWVGFDTPRKLGDKETGGGLALPIWISYMAKALRTSPETPQLIPNGVVQAGGDYYYSETRPGQGISAVGVTEGGISNSHNADQIKNQVF